MSLSEEYKRQIRENLDMEESGRLRALAEKAKAADAPVLIVGLGGTGVDALLVIKKLIHDSIECERTADGLSDKPRNIEYLAVDTDAAYEEKSYYGMRLNRDADELMIYTIRDVLPILKHPELQPPYIQNWLNPEISEFFIVPGPAGAIRQIGRLMLMGNLGSFQQVLNSKISRVTEGFSSNVPLYVFILAGISGGTGSGMFLDVPYLIKETAAAVTPQRTVWNIGLLFMPDVNADRIGVDGNKRKSIYANGYAALKELDYLMNIENTGDRFEQDYGELKVGKKDDRPYPPYDTCFLMPGKDERGVMIRPGDESYQTATETAAETVFNFVLESSDLPSFSIQRFLGRTWENIGIHKKLVNYRCPVSYYYNASSVALAELPTDELMGYLAYKIFREIEEYWDQMPADEDVDEGMRWFGLGKREIIQAAREEIKQYEALKAPREGKENRERISWYLEEPSDFIREVEKRIDTDPAFAVDMRKVVSDFYRWLFENMESWTGNRKNVAEHISAFIYKEFRNILDHSMDFFLAMTAEAKGMTLDDYCDAIVSELCEKAEIHFPIDKTAVRAKAAVSCPEYFFISIPDDSPRLFEAVRRKLMEPGMIRSIVQKIGARDRIYVMKIRNAVPLCRYADLKVLHETYKMHKGKKGLHLYEPNAYSGVNWWNLPSPYPETEWIDFEDEDERQNNDRYREILRKALRYGYVTADPGEHRLVCYWGEMADYRMVLEEYGIEPFAGTVIPARPAKHALQRIESQLKGEGQRTRLTEEFVRDDMAADNSGKELEKDYMEMAFIQMFKVRDEIRVMVENHEECLRVVEDIRARMIDNSAIQGFVLGRILGMIKKKALQYFYVDPEGVLQPLCGLSARQTMFSEYYLFDEYMHLEGKIRVDFEERANAQVRNGETVKMQDIWQRYRARMVDEKLEVLEEDWEEIDNGEKILATYQLLKDTVDDLENMFGDVYKKGTKIFNQPFSGK